MTDRLPAPVRERDDAPLAERASATPAARHLGAMPAEHHSQGIVDIPSSSLPEIQVRLLEAITNPAADLAAATALLTAGPRSSARERFEIYRYGYTARLVECLADDYPILTRAVGEEQFRELALAYIEKYPSRSPSLNAFGRHMSAFLPIAPETVAVVPRQFFAELAELEWALVEAIHAAPGEELDAAALAAVPPEAWGKARLVPSPTVRLLTFSYPVNAYFQSMRHGSAETRIPEPAKSAAAVYRHQQILWRMDLTPAMARVLGALLAGDPVGAALARMAVDESDPEAVAEAERSVMIWFREWSSSGFFSGVKLES